MLRSVHNFSASALLTTLVGTGALARVTPTAEDSNQQSISNVDYGSAYGHYPYAYLVLDTAAEYDYVDDLVAKHPDDDHVEREQYEDGIKEGLFESETSPIVDTPLLSPAASSISTKPPSHYELGAGQPPQEDQTELVDLVSKFVDSEEQTTAAPTRESLEFDISSNGDTVLSQSTNEDTTSNNEVELDIRVSWDDRYDDNYSSKSHTMNESHVIAMVALTGA